ncbi:MAG: hypothetical protein JJU16_11685 [Alkalibacterium sp.]|nr:hypothetical protein [Alkalibacterium sp.]
MSRLEELLEQHKDKLIFVEQKKEGFESIKELVDSIEEPIGQLSSPHLNSIIGISIHYKEPVDTEELNIKLYRVVENDKSLVYYDHLKERNKSISPDPFYFWDKSIYFVVKDNRDIMSLSDSLLWYDYQVNQGITHKEFRDKGEALFHYLQVFDMFLG